MADDVRIALLTDKNGINGHSMVEAAIEQVLKDQAKIFEMSPFVELMKPQKGTKLTKH